MKNIPYLKMQGIFESVVFKMFILHTNAICMNKFLLIAFLLLLSSHSSFAGEQERTVADMRELISKSPKDTSRVDMLLETAMMYVLRHDALKTDMDSAGRLANQAYKLTKELKYVPGEGKYWYVFSNIYREKNEVEKGKKYAEKAVTILLKTRDNDALGDAYLELANYSDAYSDQMLQKMIQTEHAAFAYEKAGNYEMQGKALKSLGEYWYLTGDYKSALIELQKALHAFKKSNYPERQGVYDIMMTASNLLGDHEKGLEYGLLALRTAEKVGDSSAQLYAIYNHLGGTYSDIDRYEDAEKYYIKASALAEKTTDTLGIIAIQKNLANVHMSLKQFHQALIVIEKMDKKYSPLPFYGRLMLANVYLTCYSKMGEFELAKPYVKEVLETFSKYDTLLSIHMQTYTPLVNYYMASKQYKKAIQFCHYDEAMSKRYNFIRRLSTVYITLAKADSALGNYKSALQNYRSHVVIEDSLYNQTKSWQIEQLAIEYETEKKDKNIQVLTKESLIQKNKLQQASMQRNVTFGGISLSLMIIGLLFSRYRIKQKANSKLETQQKEISEKNTSLQHLLNEKEWLLREIHHRTKNNLQTVISLLNSQSVYLQSDAALSAIQDSKHRVQAMSLIHQKLYKSDNVSNIDMHAYIVELVEYLKDCFNTGQRIRFEMSIVPVAVDVSEAVPLGLILNEAITNAIKYAFPDNREGVINITLEHVVREQYLLTISDNGVGISSDASNGKSDSLGMSLMKGLAEDIDGTFTLENNTGTLLKVSFIHDSTINKMAGENMVSA